MVPWGTGNPISSGNLNTLVFLAEKPPPLSLSEGGGSMSPGGLYRQKNISKKESGRSFRIQI
jgi:hypothetical protein